MGKREDIDALIDTTSALAERLYAAEADIFQLQSTLRSAADFTEAVEEAVPPAFKVGDRVKLLAAGIRHEPARCHVGRCLKIKLIVDGDARFDDVVWPLSALAPAPEVDASLVSLAEFDAVATDRDHWRNLCETTDGKVELLQEELAAAAKQLKNAQGEIPARIEQVKAIAADRDAHKARADVAEAEKGEGWREASRVVDELNAAHAAVAALREQLESRTADWEYVKSMRGKLEARIAAGVKMHGYFHVNGSCWTEQYNRLPTGEYAERHTACLIDIAPVPDKLPIEVRPNADTNLDVALQFPHEHERKPGSERRKGQA